MKRIATGIALSLFWATSALAQVTLESLSVAPPAPTTADSVIASVGGTVNRLELPNFRTEWKREGTDILVDVLHDFIPAPPVFPSIEMIPYTEDVTLGNLPAGTYDLTARLFSSFRDFPPPTYEQPWNFPPMDVRIVSTLSTTFTVVPEPSSLLLAIAGVLLLLRRSR